MNSYQNIKNPETPDPPVILIVDDIVENRKLLATLIRGKIECRLILAKSGQDAVKIFHDKKAIPSLILLDIMMPEMDGFEAAKKIKAYEGAEDIPILFITAVNAEEDRLRAFDAGGADFISKPFNQKELLARIGVHLKLKLLTEKLKHTNQLLEDRGAHLQKLVEEKTRKINNLNISMVSALENVNFYNDTDTGFHIRRVANYSELLARKAGLPREMVSKIELYAPLHDVGKVAIPDSILKKKEKYSDEEFEQMKQHVAIGAKMLSGEGFSQVARNIALYHHEKWSGKGYLAGLKGEEIPIEARIVALADVYDALTTKRSYKEAFSEEKTDSIIKNQSGKHFDPFLVKIFFENKKKFIKIKNELT